MLKNVALKKILPLICYNVTIKMKCFQNSHWYLAEITPPISLTALSPLHQCSSTFSHGTFFTLKFFIFLPNNENIVNLFILTQCESWALDAHKAVVLISF